MLPMKPNLRLSGGVLALLLGAVAVAISGRVLATFLLDFVVTTVGADSSRIPESFDYSWGTLEVGRTGSDFPLVAAGLVLMAIGQFLVIPPAVRRVRSSSVSKSPVLPMVALIGAAVLTGIAAASFLLVPSLTKSAFGTLAATGVADPVRFGEDLPVRSSQVFIITLVGAQLLVLVGALTAPAAQPADACRVGSILALAACACFALFATGIVCTYLGPVGSIDAILESGGPADPAMLARKISMGVNLMLFAAPLLGISAVLSLLAVVIPVTAAAAGRAGRLRAD